VYVTTFYVHVSLPVELAESKELAHLRFFGRFVVVTLNRTYADCIEFTSML